MVLVDTSIWIDHFRKPSSKFIEILNNSEVSCHPYVIGELACGNLKNRKEILSLLHSLPMVKSVENDEILFFIEAHSLSGKGLGYIDINLLASSKVSEHHFWTKDKRLKDAAERLGLGFRK